MNAAARAPQRKAKTAGPAAVRQLPASLALPARSQATSLQPIAPLDGYWARDIWESQDPFFDQFAPAADPWRMRRQFRIHFTPLPDDVRHEVQHYFAEGLRRRRLRLSTVFHVGAYVRCLADFLTACYPTLTTITELAPPEAMARFSQYLTHTGRSYVAARRASGLLRRLLLFLAAERRNDVAACCDGDDHSEHAAVALQEIGSGVFRGDVWDLRAIPGAQVSDTCSHYWLNFTRIPQPFRASVKHYLRFRVSHGLSQGACQADIRSLTYFYVFIHARYPAWTILTALTRADVEAYLVWFRTTWGSKHAGKHRRTTRTVGGRENLAVLPKYLAYLQYAQRPEAPTTPLALLWWRGDIPPASKPSDETIRYIPEGVLQQLERSLERLQPPVYIPVVMLLRASGWRISDILTLRYDTCLQRTELGWYLCGDIRKTQVLNHRVPITDEVAAAVQAVVEDTTMHSTPENNPKRLLFVRYDGARRGRPPLGVSVASALNRLAVAEHIVDDHGTRFHFGNHAFRHTKAVELINNGMSLVHVQKWLAHYSPEMTLRYARILDETLRQAWVDATKGGLFRLDGVGGLRQVALGDVADEDLVEWAYIRTHLDAVRMPHGYCFKPLKQPCPAQEQPCLSCRNLCTTTEFLSEFERQIAGTKALIAEGTARGRVVWVNKNEALLGRLEGIAGVLREQKTHHTAGKGGREYVGEERLHVQAEPRPPGNGDGTEYQNGE